MVQPSLPCIADWSLKWGTAAWAGLRAAGGLRLATGRALGRQGGPWTTMEERRRRRRRRERKEEEKKNEKRAAKCEGEASEGTERRKDGRNVYSVAVAIAAARIFNPVVIATWAAMTRKTK